MVLIVSKGQADSAASHLRNVKDAEDKWRKSDARKEAIKKFPNEHIAVRDGKIVEHFKKFDALVEKLTSAKYNQFDLEEMFTDHLLTQKGRINARGFKVEDVEEIMRQVSTDPTVIAHAELSRRAYGSLTPEDLSKTFTI